MCAKIGNGVWCATTYLEIAHAKMGVLSVGFLFLKHIFSCSNSVNILQLISCFKSVTFDIFCFGIMNVYLLNLTKVWCVMYNCFIKTQDYNYTLKISVPTLS